MNPNKKIDLAGGGYCLYAPRFPRFVDSLGFADEVLISNAPVSLLYTLAIVEKGKPRALTLEKIEQAQGKAVLSFHDGLGLKVVETRFITQDDRFVSQLDLHNTGKEDREVTVVMWSTTDVLR